ncbi:MAG: hypothetical protein WCJ95_17400 [Mariniphaga sp.]
MKTKLGLIIAEPILSPSLITAIIFDSQYDKGMEFNNEAPILKNEREIM